MRFGIYQAIRLARTPLVWIGRRRYADVPPSVRERLEHNAYRRTSLEAMATLAADPHHYHRGDLDASATVLDVGAFRGAGAAQIAELYGCRVLAFEPNPDYYADLEARFADDPRVETLPYGLGASDAVLPMQKLGPGSTVYGEPDPDAATVDVQIRDVAAVFDELGLDRVDLMKLNIEGAEYDLLERMFAAGLHDRVRYLLIQFHEWYPRAHLRRWRIRRRLRRTHEQVWCFPWIFELWCSRSDPHPPPPTYSDEEMAEIVAALERQQREAAGGSSPTA